MDTNIDEQKKESINKIKDLPFTEQLKDPRVLEESAKYPSGENLLGLTPEAAIGNIAQRERMEEAKTVPPPTILKTDKAEDFVTKAQGEVDKFNQQQVQQQEPAQKIETPQTEDTELQSIYSTIDAEYNEQVALIDQVKMTSEIRANQQLEGIRASFEKRRQEMIIYNQNRLKALEIMGGRSGRQRYAQEIQSGILSAEEREGMDRLGDLNLQEIQAIRDVENALQDNDFVIAKQKMDLAKQKKTDKQAELDKLAQLAVAQEELLLKKQAQAREDSKFLLDYEKFNESVRKNNWDQAKDIATQSGRQLSIDENGNIEMLQSLTFDNQIKQNEFLINLDKFKLEGQRFGLEGQRFGLDVEKYATQKALDLAYLELKEKGFSLDISKFQRSMDEFDLQYALDSANADLKEQQLVLDRIKAGIPTGADQLWIGAPYLDTQYNLSSVIQGIGLNEVGVNGKIRPDNGEVGWECAEYIGQFINLGTDGGKMGNTLEQKKESVEKYGLKKEEVLASGGYAVGDVIITDASDVSANGEPLQWGHAAVVIGKDLNGNLILQEANAKNDGNITQGRTIAPNASAIVGILGRQNEKSVGVVGLKEKYQQKLNAKMADNIIDITEIENEKKRKEVIPTKELLEIQEKTGVNVPPGTTRGELERMDIYVSKTDIERNIGNTNDIVNMIDSVLNNSAFNTYFGPIISQIGSAVSTVGTLDILTGKTGELGRSLNQIINSLTLEKMPLMKGVLSDADIAILKSSASKISRFDTEKTARTELHKLKSQLLNKIESAKLKLNQQNKEKTNDYSNFLEDDYYANWK